MNIGNEYKAQTERESGSSHLGLSGVGVLHALLIGWSSGKLCSSLSRAKLCFSLSRMFWDYSISPSVLLSASRKAGK